ncbi:formate-dependent phosphoribosylglycinamide formyltransferase [Corynebacterium minutissimum]|uniref:formate-dependent phosphoribosylglycinamide formyltransferase n=1 Tax=Corynebacterium minutissimum TaxID=38301 RepID=UPI001EF18E19|nr:formate-dependent phosphoribosylglycinamide formyltransferase [Corynebacterium minutissimum]MCG7229895.1 formate-dependent phosphoribosylglycinamide formyltransferase [Corynebacterium minutissimum]MCG7239048.1 formate-dependent phosphoribosylglycinamide formyltransferase [Corynebacterium minutissimum]
MTTAGDNAGRIGTPLTATATKVLLLGAGELGKQLAMAFQNLGLEVHAVDRYAGAPAQQLAHFSYIADIRDPQKVWELTERIKPDYVVPEVETVAIEALERVEEELGATVVPSARVCALTQSRESVRGVAESIGLPVSGYRFAESPEELQQAVEELGLPCIVKPDITTSGKGHVLLKEEEDVEEAWSMVRHVSSDKKRVVVERFVDFDYEVTLLAVRSIDPATGKMATWFSEPIGHRHEKGDLVESWQPMAMSEDALANARSVAARISNELGGRGVYGVELFVAGDDVYFSSVSPRPLDTAMLTDYTQRFSEFDLHVRAMLGLPIDVTLVSPGAAVILHADAELDDVSYSGLDAAMAYEETDVRLFGKPWAYSGRRMGMVATTAEDVETARDRAALASSKITVGLIKHSEFAQGPSEKLSPDDAPATDIDVIEVAEPVIDVDPKLTRSADD